MDRDTDPDARPAGHHVLPHTADLIVEAWGPTREVCLQQAVLGLVASFADVGGAKPIADEPFSVQGDSDEELLVALLDEVVYRLDVEGAVPVTVELSDSPAGRLTGAFHVVPVDQVESIGAAPKAITWHGLSFGEAGGRWVARVTVDV